MPTIYDLVTPANLAAYWTEMSNTRQPFFGESKFPVRKKLGLDLAWIKGARKNPTALQLSAFDANAIPLSRQGFQTLSTEMPFFKNSMQINEKLRQELNMVLQSNNDDIRNIILNNIFDDEKTLLENAHIAIEVMRMQLLTSGIVSIANNGQSYTYDYGVTANQKKTLTEKLWSDAATADPVADIIAWQDEIEEATGVRPNEILMNGKTFRYLRNADSIKNAIYVLANGTVTPNPSAVKDYILGETQATIYVYNKGYINDSGAFTKFVPDNVVTLMPSDALGSTWFGTTPEESDLMGAPDAQVSIVDTGIALTSFKEKDPVQVTTKASMIVLPSFEMAENIVIATVA